MTWSFGDSFDLYAAPADMANGYWDATSVPANISFIAGRFAGSQAANWTSFSSSTLVKTSGVNDAVHHFVCAFQQSAALSGTNLGLYFELFDSATAQCSIVFRSDGAILLVSGAPNSGTTLATYTGAVAAINTWYAFEFEVTINNTTGSFAVRKNGNTVNDFSATALNTRPTSTNNYANKLQIGESVAVNAQRIDDLFWQSGAATGNWLGDIRCYARMPASDQSVAFSRLSPLIQTAFSGTANNNNANATTAWYSPIISNYDGTVSSITLSLFAGWTGNLKCTLFNGTAAGPTTVLASATTLTNPATGNVVMSFSSPPTVVKGTRYWIGAESDTTVSNGFYAFTGASGMASTPTAYASFPVANPTVSAAPPIVCSWTMTPSVNNQMVNEPQEDGLTSYVYDSNPGDADFYGIGTIASTPATVIATTVRGYMQKSDAGTRTAAVQLKSGATTVASPTLTLSSSGWLWTWRTDLTDPNTGAAWTPAAVNNAQIGPKTVA